MNGYQTLGTGLDPPPFFTLRELNRGGMKFHISERLRQKVLTMELLYRLSYGNLDEVTVLRMDGIFFIRHAA